MASVWQGGCSDFWLMGGFSFGAIGRCQLEAGIALKTLKGN